MRAELNLLSAFVVIGIFGFAGLALANDTGTPEKTLEMIFGDIPSKWWEGGWDRRKEVDDLISRYPGSRHLAAKRLLYYGDYYYSNEAYDSAIKQYEKVMQDYPNEQAAPTALRHMADLYSYRKDEFVRAVPMYEQVARRYPNSPDTPQAVYRVEYLQYLYKSELARGYFDKGFDEAGLDIYYHIIEEYGRDTGMEWAPAARSDLADYYRRRGNVAQARRELEHILNEYPTSAWVASAKYLLALDSAVNEQIRIDTLFAIHLAKPTWIRHLAYLPEGIRDGLAQSKTLDEATQAVGKTLGIPNNELARRFLEGLLEIEQRNEGIGFFHLREVNRVVGGNAVLADIAGSLAYHEMEDEGWYAHVQTERKLFYLGRITPPEVALYWTARVHIDAGNYAEAVKLLAPVSTRKPVQSRESFFYALSLHETGKMDEALKLLSNLTDTFVMEELSGWGMDEKFRDICRHVGGSLEGRGYADRAVPYYQQGHCYSELGRLYCRLGNDFEAIIALEDAVRSDESDSRHADMLMLSECYERLGSFRNALDAISGAWKACLKSGGGKFCGGIAAQYAKLKLKAPAESTRIDAKAFPGLKERLGRPRMQFYTQRDLPSEANLPATARLLERNSPALASLKDPRIVFSAQDQQNIIAVGLSANLDPRGEVSWGGYWAHLSFDGGAHWTRPCYMGFAERYPYVVGPHPIYDPDEDEYRRYRVIVCGVEHAKPAYTLRMAPFKDGNIQIEVKLREVDDSTIGFHPSDIRSRWTRDDIYLEYPIDALTKDSDKDGLTDLYEEKMATDPYSDDTDKDGMPDSIDVQPLSPPQVNYGDDVAVISAVVEHNMGRVRPIGTEKVIFMISEQALPLADHFQSRVITLPRQAAELYDKKFGTHYMVEFGEVAFNNDQTEAYLKYVFGREGSVRAQKINGKWEIKNVRMMTGRPR